MKPLKLSGKMRNIPLKVETIKVSCPVCGHQWFMDIDSAVGTQRKRSKCVGCQQSYSMEIHKGMGGRVAVEWTMI
jgi:transcription elongation factor Elf1